MTVLEERLARINAEWERVRYYRDRYFCGPTAVALAANVSLEQAELACASSLGSRSIAHVNEYACRSNGIRTASRVVGMYHDELEKTLTKLGVPFKHSFGINLCIPSTTPYRNKLETLRERVGFTEFSRLSYRIEKRKVTIGLLRHIVDPGIYIVCAPGHYLVVEVTAGNKRVVVADSIAVGHVKRRTSGVGSKVLNVWRINP